MENKAASSALDLVGNTPLLRVSNIDTGICNLYLKLENQNPGGSIKDRIALSMIEAAEKEGKISPGDILVEATAGNTGIALAMIAARKGYRLILVIPDKMSQEKIIQVKAMGAEVVMARSDVDSLHPENYHNMAHRIADELPNGYFINQFDNPANPLAHEAGTGPEIFKQMNGNVDAIICGVGSGGTISGLGRYAAKYSPKTEMVLADPEGSALAPMINHEEIPEGKSWLVEGIGQDYVPGNFDIAKIRKAYAIPDREAILTCHEILKKEGILCGSSSGTLIAAALRYCREQTQSKEVVTFVCDGGGKYLSKIFNPEWLAKAGIS